MAAKGPDQAKAKNAAKLQDNGRKKYYGVEKPVTSGSANAVKKMLDAKAGKPKPGEAARRQPAKKSSSGIAGRIKTTVREARDVVTAVGSAAQAVRKSPQEGLPVKKIVKNVAKQVKEVGTAAKTGKKGTTAATVKPNKSSQNARKASGSGYVTYKTTGSKKR